MALQIKFYLFGTSWTKLDQTPWSRPGPGLVQARALIGKRFELMGISSFYLFRDQRDQAGPRLGPTLVQARTLAGTRLSVFGPTGPTGPGVFEVLGAEKIFFWLFTVLRCLREVRPD
jgi:hypothetical protein